MNLQTQPVVSEAEGACVHVMGPAVPSLDLSSRLAQKLLIQLPEAGVSQLLPSDHCSLSL